MVLANTYHLYFRPGAGLVAAHGGLHRFMGWDGPILTDSGGFQVFSLADTRVIDDDGVEFASVYDGSRHVFTPQRRSRPGAARRRHRHVLRRVRSGHAGARQIAAAVERTTRWARSAAKPRRAPTSCSSASCRAGSTSLCGVARPPTPGRRLPAYAIGGLSVGERDDEMLATVELLDGLLPDDRFRYFMGIGDPLGSST